MAKMTIRGMEEYTRKLSKLGEQQEEVSKKAVYSGAGIVADEIKRRLEINLQDPSYLGSQKGGIRKNEYYEQTGDLLDSLGIAPIQVAFGDLGTSTKVGFDGYDKHGVPNQLKARAMESGTSTMQKRPFVRPAVNASRKKAQVSMGKVVEEEIKKIIGG